MKWFNLKEFTYSETARKLKIDNTPTEEIESRIKELAEVLDGLRDAWGSPIRVNSGFRCSALNKAVGGVKTSSHLTGYAADLYPVNGDIEKFYDFCIDYFEDYDELLKEASGDTSWVHFALKSIKGEQRRKCFEIDL